MTVSIGTDTQVHAVWVVSGAEGDFFAMALKQPDEAWEVQYRFHYYATGSRNWIRVLPKDSCQHTVDSMFDHVSTQLAKSWRTQVHKTLIGEKGGAAFRRIAALIPMKMFMGQTVVEV
jgi:hypothetical protein